MTSRADATAAPTWLPLGKKKFRLRPMRDKDFGEFERWVQVRRVELVMATIPPMQSEEHPDGVTREERLELIKHAQDQAAHIVWQSLDCSRAMETLEGAAMLLWLHTHRDAPETPDELLSLITDVSNIKDILDAVDQISLDPFLAMLKRMDVKKKTRMVASRKNREKTTKRKKAKKKRTS